MAKLNLKPSHKAIRDYYATLQQYDRHAVTHEGAVSNPFAFLLDTCAKQVIEIEKVSAALMRHAMSRDAFLKPLDRFYVAIEEAATLCKDFSQKQHFLNTFYEKFFQGFSEDVADTHGIVYTPQSIVDFMVKSVEHILKTEFNRSLSDTGVHIIDPFVGTRNFIVRLMQDIHGTALEEKYCHELHCNEVMLLPYYIPSLNIEQEYFQRTGMYLPFEGIALADTFELLEQEQGELFTRENTERVKRQKAADMFVVIGNPPYNMGQINENDNNKNRKYETMDTLLKATYSMTDAKRPGNPKKPCGVKAAPLPRVSFSSHPKAAPTLSPGATRINS